MKKQEANILAAEFTGNRIWLVGAVYHIGGVDGWRILLQLREQPSLRNVIAQPEDAHPSELADIQGMLFECARKWHVIPSRTDIITLAPEGEDFPTPRFSEWHFVREEDVS